MKLRVGFVGAGAMAEALIRGLIKSGAAPRQIIASDVQAARLKYIKSQYGIKTSANNRSIYENSDVVVLAVKPQNLEEVLVELADITQVLTESVKGLPLIVSIAAGISIKFVEEALPVPYPVIRAMPNTPAVVGQGATAISPGSSTRREHETQCRSIFEAVGIVVNVPEAQMDAVTGLSGSGPAYGYVIIEALADAGVRVGLPRAVALGLAAQTLAGAAKMVLETGQHPGVLKDQVTSPGGTTIAGLQVMERGGIRGILMDTVAAAADRSKELKR
ncbi:MAG: pyrroline-5-carboxylate reductase [Firmicutes bacterium]|nr:pyrroline-5-carboxylate reductase [Bacillota bacterium]